MIIFVAQQLGVSPGAFADYALRDQTRREHAVELQPRRSLGAYGVVTLDEARETARDWLRMIKRGIDPRVELAKERAANQRRQQFTFGHVLEEFFTLAASQHKKGAATRRLMMQELPKSWASRPVVDIEPGECAAVVKSLVKRGVNGQAFNLFAYLRRMFGWAIGTHSYGLEHSPMEQLSAKDLIGSRTARDRVLSDAELAAVWHAAGQMDYPFPHIVRMLILTGGRLREISDLAWSEIDLDKLLISIPAGRMKGSRDHDIPIAPMALTLLRSLPRFTRGDYAFTCTSGVTAFQGFRKPKLRLDSLSGVTGWVLHDLRRSMRSNLSARAIEDRVREAMIAHAQPGLHAVYDKWKYVDEKRRGFTLWEQRLAGIINPTPATVADIGAARKRMSMPGQVSDLNRARTPRQAAE